MCRNFKISKLMAWLIATAVYLSAATNETTIKKTIVIEESIPTEFMQTSFTIEKTAKEPNEILKSFAISHKSIVELSKKEDITCKGGQNRVHPDYIASEKKQRIFNGYKGFVSYVCTFDKIQAYNTLLNTSLEDEQKLNLSPIQWIATEAKKKESEKILEEKLSKEALKVAEDYSLYLKAACSLKSLEVIANTPYSPYMMSYAKSERMNSAISLENFQPIQESILIQLSGVVEILCAK